MSSSIPSSQFPFLFGRAFIEAVSSCWHLMRHTDFPSFSGGLSLRLVVSVSGTLGWGDFPSFSGGLSLRRQVLGQRPEHGDNFPSFSGGLSLRLLIYPGVNHKLSGLSLPFRAGFHLGKPVQKPGRSISIHTPLPFAGGFR